MAKQLNRTLVVPPVVTLDGSLIDPWEFFDLESLPWRWIHYEDFQWAPSDMLRLVDMNAFTSGDKRFAPNIADESEVMIILLKNGGAAMKAGVNIAGVVIARVDLDDDLDGSLPNVVNLPESFVDFFRSIPGRDENA